MSSGVAARPDDVGAQAGGAVGGPPARFVLAWVRRAFLVNLVAQIGIVVTGGTVRVTGSGLGCPTWPQCVPGSYTPVVHQAQGYHKYIEFGNRMLTGVVGLTALAVLIVTIMLVVAYGARRRVIAWGAAPILLVVVQAVLGGITVRLGLNPATVAAHFLVSMVLIAASAWLVFVIDPGADTARRVASSQAPVAPLRRELGWLVVAVAVVASVILVLGTVVTGSGPHSGDALKPARFGFDPRAVSWLHADAVWLFLGLVVALIFGARLTDAPSALQRRSVWLLAVTLVQGVIGYVQYATGLPILAVVLHMLGASLLVVAVTSVVAARRASVGSAGAA